MEQILPLSGIKVIELSNMVTASLAAMILAGEGADVIKVEPLGIGDKLRHFGSQKAGISAVFNNCNRGKKSLAINLKHQAGQYAESRLIQGADILIHNYRPGVMTKLGLKSEELRKLNPKLIVCSLTGFGRQGPFKNAPAFDHVIQAMSGITAAQGKDGSLEFINMLVCDKITAYTAAQAVTAALVVQARTGQGQHIDISMLGASLAFMWPDGMMHKTLLADDALQLAPMADYYQTFQTKDGYIAAAPFGDEQWKALYKIVNRPDLDADPRFATLLLRGQNISELLAIFSDMKINQTSDQLLTALQAADIPCAPCLELDELTQNEQIQAIGAIELQEHPHLGPVMMASNPVHFTGQKPIPLGPSPLLGEHTDLILDQYGYNRQELSKLRKDNVI